MANVVEVNPLHIENCRVSSCRMISRGLSMSRLIDECFIRHAFALKTYDLPTPPLRSPFPLYRCKTCKLGSSASHFLAAASATYRDCATAASVRAASSCMLVRHRCWLPPEHRGQVSPRGGSIALGPEQPHAQHVLYGPEELSRGHWPIVAPLRRGGKDVGL